MPRLFGQVILGDPDKDIWKSAEGYTVRVWDIELGEMLGEATCDEFGAYEASIPEGNYRIEVLSGEKWEDEEKFQVKRENIVKDIFLDMREG